MPRQVFTKEIEEFIESLDGVESARVLTAPSGDIGRVYVTSTGPLESRGLRNGVVAALQSHFKILIDPWRVYVTRLRAGVPSSEIPHFTVARVEETAAAGELSVTVKLHWYRGHDDRQGIGHARGAPGTASRARALAVATIAAVRDALGISADDLRFDRVGTVAFLDREMVMVGVSARIGGEPQPYIGSVPASGAPHSTVGEPVIAAALDAAARWLLQRAFVADVLGSRDRRERLEAMRHFARDISPNGQTQSLDTRFAPPNEAMTAMVPEGGPVDLGETPDVESAGRAAPADAGRPAGAPAAHEAAEPAVAQPRGETAPSPARDETAEPPLRDDAVPAPREPAAPETSSYLSERGSYSRGGTPMAGPYRDVRDSGSMRGSSPGAASSAGAQVPRAPGMEEVFYRALVAERTPVHVRCRDGYEIPRATVREVGTYALLIETPDGPELFYKHAVISIRVLSKPAAQA